MVHSSTEFYSDYIIFTYLLICRDLPSDPEKLFELYKEVTYYGKIDLVYYT